MIALIVIGLLSGIVTGLSPCILPVLPAVLATTAIPPGGLADGATPKPDRWRPYIVIAGLVTSFATFTLIGASLLSALGLPDDLLRTIGIVGMILVGVGLLIPGIGHLLERPFARFSRVGPRRNGSAFVFGATFGLAFVPCAGPVLATITVLAATNEIGAELIALTVAFSIGVAIPLLAIALAGQQMTTRIGALRRHMPTVRRVAGGVLVVTALAIAFGLADQVQRLVPSYVSAAQSRIEDNEAARAALDSVSGSEASTDAQAASGVDAASGASAAEGAPLSFDECEADPRRLANCGPGREFVGIQQWLNTPGDRPLTLAGLKGKVVLVDFWTYSCINCQRTLPYLTEWDKRYRDAGLTIVGVHSPEFAFEHDVDNIADQASTLGVRYPIAIDNDFRTWRAYDQRFWPAHYLIDRDGTVRQVHYGEGAYEQTEELIRQLLAVPERSAIETAEPSSAAAQPDRTGPTTPETYLGYERAGAYASAVEPDSATVYHAPRALAEDAVALDGEWTVGGEQATAGRDARLLLRYTANDVYLVLGGHGTVTVATDDGASHTIAVDGAPTLHPITDVPGAASVLTLAMTPGVSAYAFTFG